MAQLLYRQVYEELKERIRSGVYSPETALPAETALQQDFSVSLITVRRALQELALEGLVERRQGKGNYVCDNSPRAAVIGLNSFTSDVASGRLNIVRSLLADEMIPAPAETAERFGLQPDSLLRRLLRLDAEGDMPLSIDEVYIPPALGSCIDTSIASSPLFLHLWQSRTGIKLVRTEYIIWVEAPDARYKKLLKIEDDVTLLATGELIFDSEDRPVLWIVNRYRADRARLSGNVTLVQKTTEEGILGE